VCEKVNVLTGNRLMQLTLSPAPSPIGSAKEMAIRLEGWLGIDEAIHPRKIATRLLKGRKRNVAAPQLPESDFFVLRIM
jgi:hypothetical protein